MKTIRCTLFLAAIVVLQLLSSTSFAQSPGNKLEGTYWAGVDSEGSYFVFEFQESGKLKYVPSTGVISKGKWKRNGNTLDVEINKRFVRFAGKVGNGRMEGTASSQVGRKWEWSATEQPIVSVSSPPKYPQIALLSRAIGSVIVELQINAEGVVTSAHALNGHPLLRAGAVLTAKSWKFSASSDTKQIRSAQLTFIFRMLNEALGLRKKYEPLFLSPYQAVIRSATPTIEYTLSPVTEHTK